MRHRISSQHFNRDSNHRKSLIKNLVRALVLQGEVVTTSAKAKELKRIADRLIHKAQNEELTTRRNLHRFFGRRDVVNTLVDRVAPAMSDRVSGFTRVAKLGNRRGDNAELSKVSLVTQPDRVGTLKSGKVHQDRVKKVTTSRRVTAAKPAPKKVAKAA